MVEAENERKPKDQKWRHKSLCFYHDIGKLYFEQPYIPKSWEMCHCGHFDINEIQEKCGNFRYRIGLNEIFENKLTVPTVLNIMIEGKENYTIQLIPMDVNEIKKMSQPFAQPNEMGTSVFCYKKLVHRVNENISIVWRLKNRFRQNEIQIPKNDMKTAIQDFWYECWAFYGIAKNQQNFSQFIALHKDFGQFVEHGDSIEKMVVLYIYSNDERHFQIQVNGKIPKTFRQCQETKQKIIMQHKKKMKAWTKDTSTKDTSTKETWTKETLNKKKRKFTETDNVKQKRRKLSSNTEQRLALENRALKAKLQEKLFNDSMAISQREQELILENRELRQKLQEKTQLLREIKALCSQNQQQCT